MTTLSPYDGGRGQTLLARQLRAALRVLDICQDLDIYRPFFVLLIRAVAFVCASLRVWSHVYFLGGEIAVNNIQAASWGESVGGGGSTYFPSIFPV